MMNFITELTWSMMVILLIIFSTFLLYLIYAAYFEYDINLSHGPDVNDKGMNLLEVAYFIGNTIVALIASISILFARSQLKHAEASRRASIYMELHKRFNSDDIRYSFRKMASIMRSYETCKRENENSVSKYADRILQEYWEQHIEAAKSLCGERTEYIKTMAILPFFEDIGVLIVRKYLQEDDLFDYIGDVIIKVESVLKDHIIWIRKDVGKGDPTIYANALKLMKTAQIAKSRGSLHSFNEGDYRIEK